MVSNLAKRNNTAEIISEIYITYRNNSKRVKFCRACHLQAEELLAPTISRWPPFALSIR